MTDWPGSLPATLNINNLQLTNRPQVVVQQPDTGPKMMRRRFSAVYELWTGQMVMTAAQWATAQTFFYTTLKGGSLPFNFKHPVVGDMENTTFVADDPQAMAVASVEGTKLIIGFKIEIGPRSV